VFIRVIALLCAVVVAAAAATANGPNGTIAVSWDNDVLGGTDDHYTNGVQIGWVSGYLDGFTADGPLPGWLASAATRLPLINDDDRQNFVSYSLSHRIFTPNDIEDPEPITGDMPYSALLTTTVTVGGQAERSMDAFSLTLGVVGPAAFGEEVQGGIHDLISATDPQGWDHQVDNEPLLNLGYEHRWRIAAVGAPGGWRADVIGQGGMMLGNMLSMVTAGVGMRFGWNLPDDYGIPPQFFGEETVGSRPWSRDWHPYGSWLFLLVNGSAFANAIFWDGNTFQDSASVDYDPYIGRVYGGLRVQWGQWGSTLGLTMTSVPWDNPQDNRSQVYGRIGLGYSY
jgi:hypothetical protein